MIYAFLSKLPARALLCCAVGIVSTTLASTDLSKDAPGDGVPDGLCDVWQNFFAAWGLDPAGDDDGDSLSNLAESIAGTDPFLADDHLRVRALSAAQQTLVFRFIAERGKRYRVLSTATLAAPDWSPVPGAEKVSTQDHAEDTLAIPKPGSGRNFYKLEVSDHYADGGSISDWAKYRRGTDPETLGDVLAQFQVAAGEQPVFAETFTHTSRFSSDRMIVDNGFARAAPGEYWAQIAYFFDAPLDVKSGEITVYFSMRADRSIADEETAKMIMHMPFADPPPPPAFPEPPHLALFVRPRAWYWLIDDPGWDMPVLAQEALRCPIADFPDALHVERIRVAARWKGGDLVEVEPAIWNAQTGTWDGFPPQWVPDQPPVIMPLSIQNQLLGHHIFKSVFFQPYSDNPSLDTVLVTVRPYAP